MSGRFPPLLAPLWWLDALPLLLSKSVEQEEQPDETPPRATPLTAEEKQDIDRLYRQFARPVARYLRVLKIGPSDLDDLCQDVFLRVCKKRGYRDREGAAGPLPFLFFLCRSVASHHRRSRWRWLRRLAFWTKPSPEGSEDEDLGELELADPNTFADPLEARQLANLLLLALEELPEQQRTLFVLRHVEGIEPLELARELKLSNKVVSNRLARAKATLLRNHPELAEAVGRAEKVSP